MEIASYNLEHLFRGAKVFNEDETNAKKINDEIAELNFVFSPPDQKLKTTHYSNILNKTGH